MPLHIDLRPDTLEQVYGNESIKISLESIFSRKKDFPHAYLFYGPSGSGKTTFAMILRSLLKCDPESFYQYDATNTRGIDFIRKLKMESKYAPPVGKIKLHLIDECHQLTKDAQEDLLKLLENDCPDHCYYVLCTTEIDKLKDTLIRRCASYQTKLLREEQMKKFLNEVVKGEDIEDFPSSIIDAVIKYSEGSPGKALIRLDQVIDIVDEEEALQAVNDFVPFEQKNLIDIYRTLLQDNDDERWDRIRETVKKIEIEPEKVRRNALAYFAAALLNSKQNHKAAKIIECFKETWFYTGKSGMASAFYEASFQK